MKKQLDKTVLEKEALLWEKAKNALHMDETRTCLK
jgi:hypothetical protein